MAGSGFHENGIAVVVPAHNASATLGRCLTALWESARRPDEIVVYDDGSTDGTAGIAAAHGARVLGREGSPEGPARARNAALAATSAGIVVFVDADVVVHEDALGRLEDALRADPSLAAVFGSYDADPPVARLAARYANLRHHFIHQTAERESATFWTGIGAIRRRAFVDAGGFDERFGAAFIEDIDLGARLKKAGARIRLVPEAQGAHCKDWTLFQLWRTDIFVRALPWSRLIATGAAEGGRLNASRRETFAAALAHLVWISALAGLIFTPVFAVVAGVAAIAWLALNARFLALLHRVGGARLLVAGAGLHWLYHVYASATLGLVLVGARLGLFSAPR